MTQFAPQRPVTVPYPVDSTSGGYSDEEPEREKTRPCQTACVGRAP